jgi:DNA-binding Xre family transcriptional regulator
MASRDHIGSDFDDFLEDEGFADAVAATAAKRVLVWRLQEIMRANAISKAELARRMSTTRATVDRLLDPDNPSVTLQTLHRAAAAVGRRLELDLVA